MKGSAVPDVALGLRPEPTPAQRAKEAASVRRWFDSPTRPRNSGMGLDAISDAATLNKGAVEMKFILAFSVVLSALMLLAYKLGQTTEFTHLVKEAVR